jgi:hypothetical protein
MDNVQRAIDNLTLQLAIWKYRTAALKADRRGTRLAVEWACYELHGWRLAAFSKVVASGDLTANSHPESAVAQARFCD